MSDKSQYYLQHTAEEIDRKLSLIDENKNLLPYPYDVNFDEYTELEDIGDGSILITEDTSTERELLLQDFALPGGGKYVISLTVTDILDKATTTSNCELTIKADNEVKTYLLSTTGSAILNLSTESSEKAILVYLKIPAGAVKGLLIKPQIETGEVKTTWVPNMDRIGTYVDRRFNGLNAKINVLTELVESLTSENVTPVTAFNYVTNADNRSVTITRYTGEDAIVVIPSKILEYDVTGIGNEAFYECSTLTHVKIPYGVTSVGDKAFTYCENLKSIELPSSITVIGVSAFFGCSTLTNIKIPYGVTSIGDKAFCYCSSLANINISDSVTSIGDSAFSGCTNLTSIKIPDSVMSIGESAFAACDNLTSVQISNNVTSIGKYAFGGCKGLTNINIPNSVTSIGYGAFEDCTSLTNINIPNSVTSIDVIAFRGCASLANIEIPNSITSIEKEVFSRCDSLTSVVIPDSVTSIGIYAFRDCDALTSIEIPDSVMSIGEGAFLNCPKLIDIYCGFAENKVSGSPWGAETANIHYNSEV